MRLASASCSMSSTTTLARVTTEGRSIASRGSTAHATICFHPTRRTHTQITPVQAIRLNFGQGHVRKMVMDSLRYWKQEMHIDGFRFDLASVFSRNADGSLNWGDAPIFSQLPLIPELGRLRLIAEPWDTGAYQLGHGFPGCHLAPVERTCFATIFGVLLKANRHGSRSDATHLWQR